MTEQIAKSIARRLTISLVTVILLTAALSVTTFVLVVSTFTTDGYLFGTGNVSLDLNNGEPVITDGDCIFEPGVTVEKTFTVENRSTCAVWYRFYFSNVSGNLADAIEVEIRDGDTVLTGGRMSEMTKANATACADSLETGERKTLTIRFHFTENSGNEVQNTLLNFDFCASAVQVRNNPDKKFD